MSIYCVVLLLFLSTKALFFATVQRDILTFVMVVYAEQIIFDNLCIDCVMMFAVTRILSVRTAWWRILLSGAIGSAAALLAGLFGGWVAWVSKAVTAPVMVVLSGRKYTWKKYFISLTLMLTLTFAYGGACYALMNAIGVSLMSKIPIGIITLFICACGVLLGRFLSKLHRLRKKNRYIYRIILTVGGATVETNAYLDSGNGLTADGLPVLVADISVLRPVLDDAAAALLLAGCPPKSLNGRFIPVYGLTGKGKMFVFRPDKLEIYFDDRKNTIFDVVVGLDVVKPIADCQVLLSPDLIAEV